MTLIVDLFAGPGGWDEGLRILGHTGHVVGIEWDADACRTGKAAGHARIRADVAVLDPAWFAGAGLIASPPCTMLSQAGTGIGRQVLDVLVAAVGPTLNANDVRDQVRDQIYPVAWRARDATNRRRPTGKRWPAEKVEETARRDAFTTALILEPARWWAGVRAPWLAMEQVPDAMPVWAEYARQLRDRGWSAWTGVLNSADFGVPQTRERAILIAARDRRVGPPEATHARHEQGEDLFGGSGRARWRSMADALGWGFDDEPSATVSAGGTGSGGGAEPFANADYRRRLVAYRLARGTGMVERHGTRPDTPVTEPAPTISGKARSAEWVMGDVRRKNGTVREMHEPAPTINSSIDNGNVRVTVEESAILQSFPPGYPWHGSKSARYQQVGNACPPLLAAHVLAAAGGPVHHGSHRRFPQLGRPPTDRSPS